MTWDDVGRTDPQEYDELRQGKVYGWFFNWFIFGWFSTDDGYTEVENAKTNWTEVSR